MNEVLRIENVSKYYGDNKVLKQVNLTIHEGEVVSLVGENGAGKSTLMNVLFGMEVIQKTGGYEGKIYVEGKEVRISSPSMALGLGIGMVHQEFMLIDDFSIVENVKLNKENTEKGIFSGLFDRKLDFLDRKAMGQDTRAALDKVGLTVDEWMPVAGLSVAHRQFVEIAKVLDSKMTKLLIFDEPTAVLTEKESEELLEIIKGLSQKGVACLFISHKLEEVVRISDHITVMRDGEVVADYERGETDEKELARVMVGRDIAAHESEETRDCSKQKICLAIRNFEVDMPSELLRGVDLDVFEGEILGIAGLAGSGKLSIANGVRGLYESRGEVFYYDEQLNLQNTKKNLQKGLGFVSEDRKKVALLLDESIETNCILTSLIVKDMFLKSTAGIKHIDHKEAAERVEELIEMLQIKCVGRAQKVGALSGGNQQKVCIASVLLQKPNLLFVSEPTRGIDIGAKQVVLSYLKKLNRESKVTIVMTSSELHELRSLCDRIAVIAEGRLAGILPAAAPVEEFGLLMANITN